MMHITHASPTAANYRRRVGRRVHAAPSPKITATLSVVLFFVLLAGNFSFARIGVDNPFYIPERLFAVLLIVYVAFVLRAFGQDSTVKTPIGVLVIAAPVGYFVVTTIWSDGKTNISDTITDLTCLLLEIVILVILLKWHAAASSIAILWSMAAAGLIFSLAGVLSASLGSRIAAFGGGPNIYSRITMLGFIAVMGLVSTKKLPVSAVCVAPVMIAATILSGSRGGMVAGAVALLFLVPHLRRFTTGQIIALALTTSVFSYLVYWRYGAFIKDIINYRIVDLTVQDHYSSGRGQLLTYAWNMFKERPVAGWGLNGFASHYQQGFTYPHNILVQAAAEGGVIGLGILLVAVAKFLTGTWSSVGNPLVSTYRAAAVLIITASMFSGGYYDARFFFIFAIIAFWHKAYNRPQGGTHGD